MLWVDKHRPKGLGKMTVHGDVASHLKLLVAAGDCPHVLFYGPSGAGKKTMTLALLREIFGAGADKMKVESKVWKIEVPDRSDKVEVELTTVSSNFHIEISPAAAGFKDRFVVQEVLKEMARNRPIDASGNKGFKVVVVNEADKLSRAAQQSLRRTMEKYSAACRLVMCATSSSKVIEAVRSRCLCVRVPLPPQAEVEGVLARVASREGCALPPALGARLAAASGRNMRRALLMLETAAVQTGGQLAQAGEPELPDWEAFIRSVASDILENQSPARLFAVRNNLYQLLSNCVPATLVLKRLASELCSKIDSELKHEVAHWAAFYEHRMAGGQKAIFHLEAFVARFMSIYKKFLIATFG